MAVFVLDRHKKPLMPCSEKRARLLLERRRAVVHRCIPFTIRIKDRQVESCALQPLRLSFDPGSEKTGLALVRESQEADRIVGGSHRIRTVCFLLEIWHRAALIRKRLRQRKAFRRHRRARKTRYRAPRFLNRRRPAGWLPPSLEHLVATTITWVRRIRRWAPVSGLAMESNSFDVQKLENPDTTGTMYQRGTLNGYAVRKYLLDKWARRCAYCGTEGVPLEIDHIVPKSRGGSDRMSNLILACRNCNQAKGNLNVRAFMAHDQKRLARILAQARASLRDAAAVNSTCWRLMTTLAKTGLPVETSTGERTKWNRTRLGLPKTHALDAACVGQVDAIVAWRVPILNIRCTGRGSHQRTRLDRYGFPRGYLMRSKRVQGFQTGDLVKAVVLSGKNAAIHVGRVAIRASGKFNIQTSTGVIQGVHARRCSIVQRGDGYAYSFRQIPQMTSV
ncbi:MAG: HNH endonuclease [Nitrospirae bacterium]|nr:MAG: HNH endonuclease [Nitrospirota bacterium]